ncbi:MAG TPA: lysophospholipid acyltransferase family protein [Tepidiformaceae bacterium]|nr:lysophospholipid acyltransferase family protein [Tepidiformaceae bacterium]
MPGKLNTRRFRPGWSTFVPAFYWSTQYLLRFVLVVVGRWTVTGRENFPASGAVIVVSNHLSNADPPILSAALRKRHVRYMAKHSLFKYPVGVITRLYGAFPVRRFDADMAALLNAERILRDGGVLGMFPEGTRSRSGTLGVPHPGTALIALRSGALVLPCAIDGTEQLSKPLNLLRKPRITVRIGTPLRVEKTRRPTEQQVSELTQQIFAAITSMLPDKYIPETRAYTGTEGTASNINGGDHPSI